MRAIRTKKKPKQWINTNLEEGGGEFYVKSNEPWILPSAEFTELKIVEQQVGEECEIVNVKITVLRK